MPNKRKVFCVGFQKTGTSSLGLALRQLGMRSVRVSAPVNEAIRARAPQARNKAWQPAEGQDEAIWTVVKETAAKAEAIYDSPAAFFVEQLDQAFPGSKFILTYREPAKWLESYKRFFPNLNGRLHQWMYGVPQVEGNEPVYLRIYAERNAAIRSYFAGRSDLLEMDLSAGDGWLELVDFLGRDFLPQFPREKPVPPKPNHPRAPVSDQRAPAQ